MEARLSWAEQPDRRDRVHVVARAVPCTNTEFWDVLYPGGKFGVAEVYSSHTAAEYICEKACDNSGCGFYPVMGHFFVNILMNSESAAASPCSDMPSDLRLQILDSCCLLQCQPLPFWPLVCKTHR